MFHYGIDLEMNKLKRSTHFQDDSSIYQVWWEKRVKTKKNEQTRRNKALHLYSTLWLSEHFHIYDCNLSRHSLQGVFLLGLSLCHVVVTSSGFRVKQMWVMIPFPLFPSVQPWINYIMSLSARFLLWKRGVIVTALRTVHTNGFCTWYSLSESTSLMLVIIATAI